MNCPQCREYLSAYLDGELAENESLEIQAHMEICSSCAAWAHDLESVHWQLEDAIRNIPIPEGLEQKIIASIELEFMIERKKTRFTALILVLFTVPLLILFSPAILSMLRFFYNTTSVFLRTWPMFINLISPVLGIGITLCVLFTVVLCLLVLRNLLKGLRINEVLS